MQCRYSTYQVIHHATLFKNWHDLKNKILTNNKDAFNNDIHNNWAFHLILYNIRYVIWDIKHLGGKLWWGVTPKVIQIIIGINKTTFWQMLFIRFRKTSIVGNYNGDVNCSYKEKNLMDIFDRWYISPKVKWSKCNNFSKFMNFSNT